MVKIRLRRLGAKKSPIFRIVVLNSTTKREAAPIQHLGFYNPKTKEMKLDKASALEWIKKGAQPTETAQYLIDNCDDEGKLIYKEKTSTKLSKKAQAKLDAEKEAQAAAASEATETPAE
ncbi:MAG: 30S ribosomal protein S16 [Candidatus Gastranaerophilales bacterium]|nr:30S ribosomal protein S16 [Candidatus Gastranaerophilales bacterium]